MMGLSVCLGFFLISSMSFVQELKVKFEICWLFSYRGIGFFLMGS